MFLKTFGLGSSDECFPEQNKSKLNEKMLFIGLPFSISDRDIPAVGVLLAATLRPENLHPQQSFTGFLGSSFSTAHRHDGPPVQTDS